MLYSTGVFIHVLSAILSIVPFFVLLPMLKKMKTALVHEEMVAYVATFQIAIRVVKHAGHVLIISGIYLLWRSGYSFATPFIAATIGLLVVSLFFLAKAFKPTMRTFNTPEYDQQQFVGKLKRATWIYVILLTLMLWFMVTKPVLW